VGAGYVTALDGKAVAEGLEKVLADPQSKQKMGSAGRKLVTEQFTWNVIAELAVSYYRKHSSALRERASGVAVGA
jgi:glycosyltransferase involved in cell wall biosynthesis